MNSFQLLNSLMQVLYDVIQIDFDVFLQHQFVNLNLLIPVDNKYFQVLYFHYDDFFSMIFLFEILIQIEYYIEDDYLINQVFLNVVDMMIYSMNQLEDYV